MTRNPYLIGLLTAGGFALVLAFMLWIVHSQITDYEGYDVEGAAYVAAWALLLVLAAVAAFIGATVIAGLGWTARRAARGDLGDLVIVRAEPREDGFSAD